ncbi:MAG: hypothetical protein NT079_04690, partial [Candidatus Omnitrophica bacterium]|nr:hypothetical protein [Candidatus Omnitrophota bacterium]
MKIRVRLILGFLIISFLLAIFGYVSIGVSRHALENRIEEGSAALAQIALREIDHIIFSRIEFFESFSNRIIVRETLEASNQEFSKIKNLNDYLLRIDKEWTTFPQDKLSPQMSELLNSPLASELKMLEDYYKKKYG